MGFQRILFRFSKEGEARFLSHRDLMRLFERALRRAELPVRMTEGFNPHPKLSILAALALGLEASEEAIEIAFEPPVAPAEAVERLRRQLPEGVGLRSAQALPDGARARAKAAVYEAMLPPGCEVGPDDVERLLARDAIEVERSGRAAVDIRPALEAMALNGRRLTFRVRIAERGTPKAIEVLAELLGRRAAGDPRLRVRRTGLELTISSPSKKG